MASTIMTRTILNVLLKFRMPLSINIPIMIGRGTVRMLTQIFVTATYADLSAVGQQKRHIFV